MGVLKSRVGVKHRGDATTRDKVVRKATRENENERRERIGASSRVSDQRTTVEGMTARDAVDQACGDHTPR